MLENASFEDVRPWFWRRRNLFPLGAPLEECTNAKGSPPIQIARGIVSISQCSGNRDDALVLVIGKRDENVHNTRRTSRQIVGRGGRRGLNECLVFQRDWSAKICIDQHCEQRNPDKAAFEPTIAEIHRILSSSCGFSELREVLCRRAGRRYRLFP